MGRLLHRLYEQLRAAQVASAHGAMSMYLIVTSGPEASGLVGTTTDSIE